MSQDINCLFQSMEIIEPMAMSEEFQMLSGGSIKCDKGYVCGVGEVHPD